MDEHGLAKRVAELVKAELNKLVAGQTNSATFLHVVNTSAIPIQIGLTPSYPDTPGTKVTPIGNVPGSFATVPIDLRNRSLSSVYYRLCMRTQNTTNWILFNPQFVYIAPTNPSEVLMRASFQIASKGAWSCTGPTFSPATATKSNRVDEAGDEDLPGDPLDL